MTTAEQREAFIKQFEQMTGETVPETAKNIDILAWIRDEIAEAARVDEDARYFTAAAAAAEWTCPKCSDRELAQYASIHECQPTYFPGSF